MKNEFQMDQDVILTENAFSGLFDLIGKGQDVPARFGGVQTIQRVFETSDGDYEICFRYQISSLWFDEDDLIPVNKKDDPEYYL